MNYLYSRDAQPVAQTIAATIRALLADNKKVLWFVSGGSGGKVTVAAAKLLQADKLENLSVTLSDERYGPVGHKDENWNILLNDGFSLPGATLYRPLIGKSREETAAQFADWLTKKLQEVDYVIGLFGMGSDGHTAGIKPQSIAVHEASLVAHFQGDDFERITITPACIGHIDEGVLQVFGQEKHAAVKRLLREEVPINDQPAQILKRIPKLTVYSDYKEELV